MIPWGIAAAALGIGSSLFGASNAANASVQAAKTQANAANQATNLQRDIFNQTQTQLSPYYSLGTNALSALQSGVGSYQGNLDPNAPFLQSATSAVGQPPGLTLPQAPTFPTYNPSGFQQSPGYQWQLGQGLSAAENLGSRSQGTIGGNTLKALQTYGSGLANQDYYNWLQNIYNPGYQSQVNNAQNTYNNQFQNQLTGYNAGYQNWNALLNAFNTSQGNQFNRLAALTGGGQNAAVSQGNFGQNFGAQAGANTILSGSALSAGTLGASNAINTGLTSATNNLLSPNAGQNSAIGNALSQLFGGGGNTGNLANNNPFAYSINAAQNTAPVSYGAGYNF